MSLAKELRKLNTDRNRTDIENLFLKEMAEEDRDDILLSESDELDDIIPDNVTGNSIFGNSSSSLDLDTMLSNDDIETMDLDSIF